MMSLSDTSEIDYFTEVAQHATNEGLSCYRFIPSKINLDTKLIKGKRFEASSKNWLEEEFPIPQILYDRCFYGENIHSKQCLKLVSWLKTQAHIQFLGYGLPNKFTLYKVLKQSPLHSYIPFTKLVKQPSMLLSDLSFHRGLVLKPINGSQGIGIYYIEQQHDSINVKTFIRNQHVQRVFPNKEKFLSWIQLLLTKKEYLVQPYLELTNQNMEPFDIRVLLQKEANGQWIERGRGIRVGSASGIISNMSAGGVVKSIDTWQDFLSPSQIQSISKELNDILHHIPIVMEDAFLPLFELGIDIGLAKNGSIWILDINSKPGRKVVLETNPSIKEELYKAPILYAKTFGKGDNYEERKRFDAKTLSY
jgi:glutathione synthase/RimK-type ligase-like ATP-grasp enzyme